MDGIELRDELGGEPAGWFFRAGDAADLARVIEAAFAEEAVLTAMGSKARRHALSQRSWWSYAAPIVQSLAG